MWAGPMFCECNEETSLIHMFDVFTDILFPVRIYDWTLQSMWSDDSIIQLLMVVLRVGVLGLLHRQTVFI